MFDHPPPFSPQARERCPQNMFDPILRDFAASLPSVTLRYRCRLTAFREHDDHVGAELEDTATGARWSVRASFLVGCDGASSGVRHGLGVRMAGNPALTYSTNILFRCASFNALHDKGRAYRYVSSAQRGFGVPWSRSMGAITGDCRSSVVPSAGA